MMKEGDFPLTDAPSYSSLIFSLFLLIVFGAGSIEAIQNYLLMKKSRKWHGSAAGSVTEIKQDYYYGRLFRKRWFEYPVVTYKAGSETYCLEYPRRKKALGYYEEGETISLLYNEGKPEEFIFSDEFSGFFYYGRQILMLSVYVACLWFSVGGIKDYYLSTHEFLFEEETWKGLEKPLADYQDMSFSNVYQYSIDGMDSCIEEAVAHFSRVDKMIEEKRGKKSYDKYRGRYREAAIAASRNLAHTYAEITGVFLEKCGLEGEKELVYQSAMAGFLAQICPSEADEPRYYSMEELSFLVKFVRASGLNTWEFRADSEESIGLSLAVFYAKVDAAITFYSYGDPFKETVEKCFPGYISLYMDQVDEAIQGCAKAYGKEGYPPLNREAVNSVYQYMAAQYKTADTFQTALWNGSVFAKKQLLARQKADPTLQGLARYAPVNNPLSVFDYEAGMDAYFNSDEDLTNRSPQYYLYDWEHNNFLP